MNFPGLKWFQLLSLLLWFGHGCNCSEDSPDLRSQCGVPWDDVNAIAEAAIIQKCLDDLAAGYISYCGFRIYFEILWNYMTRDDTPDVEMTTLGEQLWDSLMYPGVETEPMVRKALNKVFLEKGINPSFKSDPFV